MYLLLGGTAVLEHFRAQADARIKKLRTDYQIDALERQTAEADSMIEEKKKLYADRLSNLRRNISETHPHAEFVQGSMTLSSSALGDVVYYFTAKNNPTG